MLNSKGMRFPIDVILVCIQVPQNNGSEYTRSFESMFSYLAAAT